MAAPAHNTPQNTWGPNETPDRIICHLCLSGYEGLYIVSGSRPAQQRWHQPPLNGSWAALYLMTQCLASRSLVKGKPKPNLRKTLMKQCHPRVVTPWLPSVQQLPNRAPLAVCAVHITKHVPTTTSAHESIKVM